MANVVQSAYAYTAYSETTLDLTFSQAVAAGNSVIVGWLGPFGNTITSVVFNGNAMTEDLNTNSAAAAFFSSHDIQTGGTVVAITKANGAGIAWAIEVSGLSAAGQPDSSNVWAATEEVFGTSHSEAVAPVVDGGFGVVVGQASNSGETFAAVGAAVMSQSADETNLFFAYEDGLAQSADSIAWTCSGDLGFSVASVVYAPAASGPTFSAGPTVDQITQGGARIRATGDLP